MSKFDVFDKNFRPIGRKATFEEVRTQGLWHQGVQTIIHTPEGLILLQKRSSTLDYHPSEIEISVGGGVNAGETPPQAAAREILEETGTVITESSLHYLGRRKLNHTYVSHGRRYYKRVFLHLFETTIAQQQAIAMKPVDSEAAELFLMPRKKVLAAVARHYIRGHGRLSSLYAIWKYLVVSS